MTMHDANDRALESWVESANAAGCDFPIQNLPFGRFRRDNFWKDRRRFNSSAGIQQRAF